MVQVTVLDALLSVDENGQTLDNIPRVGFTLSIENRSSNSLYVPFGEGKSDFIIEFDCMGTKIEIELQNPTRQNVILTPYTIEKVFLITKWDQIATLKDNCNISSLKDLLFQIAERGHMTFRNMKDDTITQKNIQYSAITSIQIDRSPDFDIHYSGT